MNTDRFVNWFCYSVIGGTFVLALALYPKLPDPVPTHFNLAGEADGWMPKPWGAFVGPFVTLFLFLVMVIIPKISPKNYRMEPFAKVIRVMKVFFVIFGAFVTVTSLSWAMGAQIIPMSALGVAVGLVFVVLGNYMGKLTKNFFIGIRTPWTLASDRVWSRTHRLAGWLFVLAGLAMIVGSLAGMPPVWAIAMLLSAALIPVVYSYFVYRNLEGFGPDE